MDFPHPATAYPTAIKVEHSGDDYPGYLEYAPYRAYYEAGRAASPQVGFDGRPIKREESPEVDAPLKVQPQAVGAAISAPIKTEPQDDEKPIKAEPAEDDSGVQGIGMNNALVEAESEDEDSDEASTVSDAHSEADLRRREEWHAAYLERHNPRLWQRSALGRLAARRARRTERKTAERSARRIAKRDAEIRARRARDVARRHVGIVVISARQNRAARRDFNAAGGKSFS